MKEKKDFGLYIQQKRKEKNLTQAELAEKLYVTESAVSKWERGLTYPDITLITRICEVLDINENEFITATSDTEYHRMKKESKKYRLLTNIYFWSLTICYLVAILTCFIVNLAVNHTLSWFFLVLPACILGYTITPSISRFLKKNKLLFISLSILLSLWLLLLIVAIYTNGKWFFIASSATLLGYLGLIGPFLLKQYEISPLIKINHYVTMVTIDVIALFILLIACRLNSDRNWLLITITSIVLGYCILMGPKIITSYNVPIVMKKNKALFSVIIDYIALILLIVTIPTVSEGYIIGKALIISLYVLGIVIGIIMITNYLKCSRNYKLAMSFTLIGFAYYFLEFIIATIWGIEYSYAVNFSNWQGSYLNGNIYLLVLIGFIIMAVINLVIAIKKKK